MSSGIFGLVSSGLSGILNGFEGICGFFLGTNGLKGNSDFEGVKGFLGTCGAKGSYGFLLLSGLFFFGSCSGKEFNGDVGNNGLGFFCFGLKKSAYKKLR